MISSSSTIKELIEFQVTGLIVVLLTLSFLAICCSCVSYIFKFLDARKKKCNLSVENQNKLEEENTHIRAIIAAAVNETFKKPHKIVQVRSLTSENKGWSLDGRSRHHTSHKIR